MRTPLTQALADGRGVVTRDAYPHLIHVIEHAARRGELVRLLPGVYVTADDAGDVRLRARAASVADPDAVITGVSAAIIGGWDGFATPDAVTVACPRQRRPQAGFAFERRVIDRAFIKRVDGIPVTTFPLTALDLAAEFGDDRIDDALRRGVDPAKLKQALAYSGKRRGFAALRPVVESVRDRPWSKLERLAHEQLRAAGVTGWRANRAIYATHDQRVGYGDLVFYDLSLIIELDSVAHHGSYDARARDTMRDRRLQRLGWEVIRVPSDLVLHHTDEFVAIVRDIVTSRASRRGETQRPDDYWGRP
ncbi:MAG: DUF559 domain-containing protein [Propioniciclava sp.]|uniref:DUF559 domain-containing protein n=1 Tax=Propioniciclava sp. TaxID=2038686 RepID=UPI0039E5775C